MRNNHKRLPQTSEWLQKPGENFKSVIYHLDCLCAWLSVSVIINHAFFFVFFFKLLLPAEDLDGSWSLNKKMQTILKVTPL